MKSYKVWLEIEEYRSDTDEYEDIPIDLGGFFFLKKEAAIIFANNIHEFGHSLGATFTDRGEDG